MAPDVLDRGGFVSPLAARGGKESRLLCVRGLGSGDDGDGRGSLLGFGRTNICTSTYKAIRKLRARTSSDSTGIGTEVTYQHSPALVINSVIEESSHSGVYAVHVHQASNFFFPSPSCLTPICKPLGFIIHQASDYIASYPNNHEIGILRTKTHLKEDTVSNQNEKSWNDSRKKGKSDRGKKTMFQKCPGQKKKKKKRPFHRLG